MDYEIVSLSASIGGPACGIADSLKRNNLVNRKTNEFFDYIITSFKSINQVLKGQPIEFENKCNLTGIVKFKNFDLIEERHALSSYTYNSYFENIKKNEPIINGYYSLENYPEFIVSLKEKYERKLERFLNLIKNNNKIYFVRYCDCFNDSIENDINEFFFIIKTINNNLDARLILFTLDGKIIFPNSLLSKNTYTLNLNYKEFNEINLEDYNNFLELLKPMTKFIIDIEKYIGNKNKNAITILTRGYEDNEKYLSLINRNKAIEKNLINKMTDILIFHEGNISEKQQLYIKKQTPKLNIIFTDISEYAFKKEHEKHKWYEPTNKKEWQIGYRHMCHFWFIDFLKYCENYDYIIRIDEDCFIDFNIDEIFVLIKNKIIIAGFEEIDDPKVTFGLNNYTLEFLKQNNITNVNPKKPSGPYTNIFAVNLIKVRNHNLILKYMEYIDNSNNIYIYRWGDLPLWGEVLYYMCKPEEYLITEKIKYFHGSLVKYVNGSSSNIREMVAVVYKEEIEKVEMESEILRQKEIRYRQLRNQRVFNNINKLIQNKKINSRFKLM
jgi:hypothetical protein